MNFAEGKGPKQVKKPYVLGQFVTIYGNDGTPGTVNPPATPYTAVQGTANVSGQSWAGGQVGSVVPGLNLNVNGNGATDIGFPCSPGSNETVQDVQNAGYTLNTDPKFVGSANVWLQGTSNRYWDNDNIASITSTHWVNITGASGTISGGNAVLSVSPTGTPWPIYNAYRVVASGATASGIINWSIAGMFTDFSAQRIGFNALDANGGLGQLQLQEPKNYTISGGQYVDNDSTASGTWEYSNLSTPYSPIKNNADFYG
jgi:hypothetical protein